MATVNINEILGSDSISGSRVTINSNFLTLQNWINGYVNVFGIDTINGILDSNVTNYSYDNFANLIELKNLLSNGKINS